MLYQSVTNKTEIVFTENEMPGIFPQNSFASSNFVYTKETQENKIYVTAF